MELLIPVLIICILLIIFGGRRFHVTWAVISMSLLRLTPRWMIRDMVWSQESEADPEMPFTKPATTTAEQDRQTAGQRVINRTWENVQAILAISVVEVTLATVCVLALRDDPSTTAAALAVLYGMVNLVIGFYFGRTNHARWGHD